jgi:hypothetical protein
LAFGGGAAATLPGLAALLSACDAPPVLGGKDAHNVGKVAHNVKDYGARGNAKTDDTQAIQRAIDAARGGQVFIPAGTYRITRTLKLVQGTRLTGATTPAADAFNNPATSQPGDTTRDAISAIDASSLNPGIAIRGADSVRGMTIEKLFIRGPESSRVTVEPDHDGTKSCGIYSGNPVTSLRIIDCAVLGFANGITLEGVNGGILSGVWTSNHKSHGLNAKSAGWLNTFNCQWANAESSNVFLQNAVAVHFYESNIDESLGYTVQIVDGSDISFNNCSIFIGPHTPTTAPGGVLIGNGASHPTRITLNNVHVLPFNKGIPQNTIRILPGARDVRLINVSTDPNGGGDIHDEGTNTVYVNVNGRTSFPNSVVAAAQFGSNLPGGGRISQASGAPHSPNGVSPNPGDIYFRTDTPAVASQRIYVCTVGGGSPTWLGIV